MADLPSARYAAGHRPKDFPFKQGFQALGRADNLGKSVALSLNLRGFFLKLLR